MGFLNRSLADAKIGVRTDRWTLEDTVLGYSNAAYQHVHNPALCYPTLASGIQVNTAATAWALGAFTEIIPANAIIFNGRTAPYDIHWINFESASANGSYEIHLFRGLAGSEQLIASVRTAKNSNVAGVANVPVQIPALPAGERISARLASDGGNRSVVISVYWHPYV